MSKQYQVQFYYFPNTIPLTMSFITGQSMHNNGAMVLLYPIGLTEIFSLGSKISYINILYLQRVIVVTWSDLFRLVSMLTHGCGTVVGHPWDMRTLWCGFSHYS